MDPLPQSTLWAHKSQERKLSMKRSDIPRKRRRKPKVSFNLMLLKNLAKKLPIHSHQQLPSEFSSMASLYKQLAALALLEATFIAQNALRSKRRTGFPLAVEEVESEGALNAVVPKSLSASQQRCLRPSTLFLLTSGLATPKEGVLAMLRSYDGAARRAIFDTLPSSADATNESQRRATLRAAFPLASMMSLRRMYSCCQRRPAPIFAHQLMGVPVARHIRFNSDGEESSDMGSPVPTGAGKRAAAAAAVATAALKDLTLNESQRHAVARFLDAATPAVQLLQGPPGTGKTHTVVRLLHYLLGMEGGGEHQRVVVCAPSNKAVHVVLREMLGSIAARAELDVPCIALVGVDEDLDPSLRSVFLHDVGEHLSAHAGAAHAAAEAVPGAPLSEKRALLAVVEAELDALERFVRRRVPRSFEQGGASRALRAATTAACGTARMLRSIGAASTGARSNGRSRARSRSRSIECADEGADIFSLVSALERGGDESDESDDESGSESGDDQEWRLERVTSCELAVVQACAALSAAVAALPASSLEWEWANGADLIFCTLCCAGRSVMRERKPSDVLIVDEAAQAIEAEALIALQVRPRRLLLVGDPCQLCATVQSPAAASAGFARSLMARLMITIAPAVARALVPGASTGASGGGGGGGGDSAAATAAAAASRAFGLLETQYRMHPKISAFPSAHFYGGRLRDAAAVQQRTPPWGAALPAFFVVDVRRGAKESAMPPHGSFANVAEAEWAARLWHCFGHGPGAAEVAMLTFYSGQVAALNKATRRGAVRGAPASPARVCTVDSFQGSETDVVVLSCVRCNARNNVGFVADFRRLNVALTRAKRGLIVLAHVPTLEKSRNSEDLRALVAYARARDVVFGERELEAVLGGANRV